jgi:hypothetical protein
MLVDVQKNHKVLPKHKQNTLFKMSVQADKIFGLLLFSKTFKIN